MRQIEMNFRLDSPIDTNKSTFRVTYAELKQLSQTTHIKGPIYRHKQFCAYKLDLLYKFLSKELPIFGFISLLYIFFETLQKMEFVVIRANLHV